MKLRTLHCIVASMMLLCGTTQVGAAQIVLDFEDLSGQGPMPDPYQGIIDWEDGVWFHFDFAQPPYNPKSGVVRTYQTTTDTTPSWRFLTPVVFDGAWWSGQSFATAQYELYDSLDTLVHTSGVVSGSSTPTFLASGYSGLVSRVVVLTPQADFIVMDDLTYSTAIPEPGTLALLGLGLAGLAASRRRKQ